MLRALRLFTACLVIALPARAETISTVLGPLAVQPVLTGLTEPWSIAFLPEGGILVTERGGRLLLADDGKVSVIDGTPLVVARGQGGLLDVLVPRDFADTRELLLSYASRHNGDTGTTLARATLSEDKTRLTDLRVLFSMTTPSGGGQHFGGRIVEARDGHIFLTMGERGDMDRAQELSNHNGTVIRLNRDGSVPQDNPFAGQPGALPEIWSYGHRNPQGAALDLQGNLWVNEHGAMGGDEVNRIVPGANFGWPVISYGRHYTGAKIGIGTESPGMEQPRHYWDPSIAPSGMMIYSGKLWPDWRGDFFVGSLKFDYIARLDPGNGWAEEQIKGPKTARVRDIREAPDGAIWFLSVDNGAAYRIVPGN